MKTQTRLLIVVLVALVMAVLLIAPTVSAGTFGPGSPDLPAVAQSTTYTFFNAKVLTTSTTITYSTAPLRLGTWAVADVFVTGVVSGSTAFTITPQYSADNTNWVNASYTYVTWNQTGTATLNTGTPQVVINSNTSSFVRIPMAGEYLRFKVDNAGYVTITLKATMKNGTR
jgi:hypothetical protein